MNIFRLKRNPNFSLMACLICSVIILIFSDFVNIAGYINKQFEIIKENEMKYVYAFNDSLGDGFLLKDSPGNYLNNRFNHFTGISRNTAYIENQSYFTMLEADKSVTETSLEQLMEDSIRFNSIYQELQTQVDRDSFRDKKLGIYYVFSYDYTMNALKELENSIDRISAAQKVPKSLLTAVLFREMMFLGQEDLLDGIPIIGGKSMGICQIGIENVRHNEQIVHGAQSLIINESDDQIKTMLQNPKYAVYFCAVQLRARAIKLTDNPDIDLNNLNEEQLKKVLENYNLSKISVNIGPIKTKEMYAIETYRYYELFKQYYNIQQNKTTNN